jgi:hypothetical protein
MQVAYGAAAAALPMKRTTLSSTPQNALTPVLEVNGTAVERNWVAGVPLVPAEAKLKPLLVPLASVESMMQAVDEEGVQTPAEPPKDAMLAEYPTVGYVVE